MPDTVNHVTYPELVIGIAGPIGVDVDAISNCTEAALNEVRYRAIAIKLTDEMAKSKITIERPQERDFYNTTKYKMDHANKLCSFYKDRATIASMSISAINTRRRSENSRNPGAEDQDSAIERTAFLVRQLKRPQEVELFSKIYGKQFVLISAYGSLKRRSEIIESKLKRTLPRNTPAHGNCSAPADGV